MSKQIDGKTRTEALNRLANIKTSGESRRAIATSLGMSYQTLLTWEKKGAGASASTAQAPKRAAMSPVKAGRSRKVSAVKAKRAKAVERPTQNPRGSAADMLLSAMEDPAVREQLATEAATHRAASAESTRRAERIEALIGKLPTLDSEPENDHPKIGYEEDDAPYTNGAAAAAAL